MYGYGCSYYDYINDFITTGGLTNISHLATGCASGSVGYSDYTYLSASQVPSGTVNFEITTFSPVAGVKIWIDFNDDGDFDDAGELVYNSGLFYDGITTGSFVVPAWAPAGPHRMRVRLAHALDGFTPCDYAVSGEIHDYTFIVACGDSATEVTASASDACIGDSLYLYASSTAAGMTYSWTGPAGFTSSEQNPVLYPATAGMSGVYRVIATDSTYGCKDTAFVTVNIHPKPTAIVGFADGIDSTCLGNNIVISATGVSGGVGPFTYSWSENPSGVPVVGTSSTISYTTTTPGPDTLYLTITNEHGCSTTYPAYFYVDTNVYIDFADSACYRNLFLEPYWYEGLPVMGWGEDVTTLSITNPYTGCTKYVTISLFPIHPDTVYINDTICESDIPYVWDGGTVSSSGSYVYTLTGSNGCDSHTILNLFVNPPKWDTVVLTVCETELPFVWNDIEITSGGEAVAIVNATDTWGCDSNSVLSVVVLPSFDTTINASICFGGEYLFVDTLIQDAGYYTRVLTTTNGCDSVVHLNLSIDPIDTINIDTILCAGQSFDFFGMVLSDIGSHTLSYIDTSEECHQLWLLYLTINDTIRSYDTVSICSGGSLVWGGITLTDAGYYSFYGVNASGCDTVHYLTLTVEPLVSDTTEATICSGASYAFHGSEFNTGGTHTVLATDGECDTLFVLNLSVNDTIRSYDTVSICSGSFYTWGGVDYGVAGTYAIYGSTSEGCDTVHYLTIVVEPPYTISFDMEVCAGGSVLFGGTYYSESGTYFFTDTTGMCDTVYIMSLVVADTLRDTLDVSICSGGAFVYDGTALESAGYYTFYYTTVSGCDSILVIHIDTEPVYQDTIFAQICGNETYNFYGAGLTSTGTYTYLDESGDCDTLRVLNLEVIPTLASEFTLTICSNELPTTILGIEIPYGTPSTYNYAEVTFTAASGCDSIVSLHLEVRDTNRVDIDTMVCYGTVFEFGSNVISEEGVYTLTLTNMLGCDSVVALHVQYSPKPISEDTLIQECGLVVYNGIEYFERTQFVDTIHNFMGCDSVWRFVYIDVLYEPKDTIFAEICQGESYHFNGVDYYNPTVVSATYPYHNGCDSTVILVLTVHPLPNTQLAYITPEPEPDVLCVFDSVQLFGTGAHNYLYFNEFNEFLGSGEAVNVRLNRLNNAYYVVGFSQYGCVDTGHAYIEVGNCCEVLMPNAFSPNNDGINDYFGPVTFGNPLEYRFIITNRYGEILFESFNIDHRWDGTTRNGKPVDAGIYFYQVTGKCYDGSPIYFKGDVTLIR